MAPHDVTNVDATGVDLRLPARTVLATSDGDLPGANLRVYRTHSQHTQIPPLRDVAVIAWQTNAQISLRCGRIRSRTQMTRGDFSIISPGFESTWQWNTGFEATVLYLNSHRLADFASEVFDRCIDGVAIREAFQVRDPVMQHGIALLATELRRNAVGGAFLREALLTQLSVHLLRHHADIRGRAPRCPGGLNATQARRVADYIDGNLAADLSLRSLADIAGISQYHFARLFKNRFGVPPHAFVQRRRVERARHLIVRRDMELKEVAGVTGFCDQSHLTKSIKRAFGATPLELRRAAGGD